MITISTRAALKRHHTYNLVLGLDTGVGTIDWSLDPIGSEAERLEVDRELAQLREQLSQVEQWKARREEIERELNQVWVVGEDKELEVPQYHQEGSGAVDEEGIKKEDDVVVVGQGEGSGSPTQREDGGSEDRAEEP